MAAWAPDPAPRKRRNLRLIGTGKPTRAETEWDQRVRDDVYVREIEVGWFGLRDEPRWGDTGEAA